MCVMGPQDDTRDSTEARHPAPEQAYYAPVGKKSPLAVSVAIRSARLLVESFPGLIEGALECTPDAIAFESPTPIPDYERYPQGRPSTCIASVSTAAMPFYTPSKATFKVAGRDFPRITWWKEPGMRSMYICLGFVVLTSATNGYDGSLMNGLQAMESWKTEFNIPSESARGLLNAIMSVGSICALPVVPYTADILGRRWGIIIGCTIMILGVVLQSIGINLQLLTASRFFVGFGVAIAHGASPLLVTELVHPQHRAIYTTIYNCTWYFGSIVAAWTAFGTNKMGDDDNWAWRIPTMLQAMPSCLQMIFIWFVPESPRFLIAKGKHEQALKVLADVHARGHQDDELVQLEFAEITETIKLEQEFESNGWQQLISTKGNRHRLIILVSLGFFSQWSGNGLVSYYMSDVLELLGIKDSDKKLQINGILNIVNFCVALFMCFWIDKLGRRPLFLTATSGMLGSFIVWTACASSVAMTNNYVAANAEITFIFIFYCFYNMAWSGLLVGYAVEILPYNIRAKGMTVLWFAIDLSLFFNSYVNPIALGALGWKYYIVYDVWLAFELFIVWLFYIETSNTPLEEIVKHFDGEAALLGGAVATEKGRHLVGQIEGYRRAGGEDGLHGMNHIDVKAPEIMMEERVAGPKTRN
ncbi:hypothetical protein V493_05976 [Pseudogymnoascus sp. VKM F-4281 (FW-2241)]|nr:hypothetical protein V493_05976 [Pseudogymnoascus sp. VKM F-4281 (FW-2241)]